MPTLRAASFNMHGGVDGWGRPFDLEEVLQRLDADVVCLQEVFSSSQQTGIARLCAKLGYHLYEAPLGHARLLGPHPGATSSWGPPFRRGRHEAAALRVFRTPLEMPFTVREPKVRGEHGTWGIALLSRTVLRGHRVIDLGKLRRDRTGRKALCGELCIGETLVRVVATHMSHLSYGSPLQFRRLARALGEQGTTIIGADMNAWSPIVTGLLPRYRRAVQGRTWPSWAPHSQIDHLLVTNDLYVEDYGVLDVKGSDHRPIWATLRIGEDEAPAAATTDTTARRLRSGKEIRVARQQR